VSKKTKVVKANLSPEWNETLDLAGNLKEFLGTGLTLKVMDWDMIGSDDPLGDVTLSLDWVKDQPHRDFAERLPKQGIIHFSVTWLPAGDLSWTVNKQCKYQGCKKQAEFGPMGKMGENHAIYCMEHHDPQLHENVVKAGGGDSSKNAAPPPRLSSIMRGSSSNMAPKKRKSVRISIS
jgi:hypothetical protein